MVKIGGHLQYFYLIKNVLKDWIKMAILLRSEYGLILLKIPKLFLFNIKKSRSKKSRAWHEDSVVSVKTMFSSFCSVILDVCNITSWPLELQASICFVDQYKEETQTKTRWPFSMGRFLVTRHPESMYNIFSYIPLARTQPIGHTYH